MVAKKRLLLLSCPSIVRSFACYHPNSLEVILALTQGKVLSGYMILTAMLAVALLLVGSPMPERSKVMSQVKRGTLVLQVGSWAWD